MKHLLRLLACLLAFTVSASAQTKAVTKTIATDTLTETAKAPAWMLSPLGGNATIAPSQYGIGWADSRFTLQTPVGALQFYSTGSPAESVIYWPGRFVVTNFESVTITGSVSASTLSGGTISSSILATSFQGPFSLWQSGEPYAGTAGLPYATDSDVPGGTEPQAGTYYPQAFVATVTGGTNEIAGRYRTAAQFKSDLALTGADVGLAAPGTSGNVLTSNGTAWLSSAPTGGGGGGNITINTTAPLTINGGSTATTSNATLAISAATTSTAGVVQLATDAQARALTSSSTVTSPAQSFISALNMLRVDLALSHPNTSAGAGGNGTTSVSIFDTQLNTVSGGTSFARRSLTNRISLSGDGGAVNFNKPFGFQILVEPRQITTNGYFRFTLTGANTDPDAVATVARPTQRAIGCYILNGLVFGVVHDGTTRTETSLGLSVNVLNASPFGRANNITCIGTGNGSYQFFVNGVSGGTLSGGPTGLSSTQWSPDYLNWHLAVSSGGDAGATNYYVRQAYVLHAQ